MACANVTPALSAGCPPRAKPSANALAGNSPRRNPASVGPSTQPAAESVLPNAKLSMREFLHEASGKSTKDNLLPAPKISMRQFVADVGSQGQLSEGQAGDGMWAVPIEDCEVPFEVLAKYSPAGQRRSLKLF